MYYVVRAVGEVLATETGEVGLIEEDGYGSNDDADRDRRG